MGERFSIGMVLLDRGAKSAEAQSRFAAALDGARVSEPDETGAFEVAIECKSQEAALDRVWDAVAASGADDHIAFLEHPSLPEHWRHKAQGPRA
jgi:hypothetical protein